MTNINIRIEEQEKEQLKMIAANKGMTLSQLIRFWVRQQVINDYKEEEK